jgi:protein-tyrosine phosphatase
MLNKTTTNSNCPFTGHTANISNILDNMLFLGSQYSSRTDELVKNNITNVISIGCNPIYNNSLSIKNYKFNIEDNGNKDNVNDFFTKIIPEIHNIINTLLQNNDKVLVHCQAGISRSAIVIITWLMKYKKMDFYCALSYVKKIRPVVCPNSSFINYINNNII